METTDNILNLSPLFQHLDEAEQEEARRYYAEAVKTAKVQTALKACPQALTSPSATKAVIDFGLSLAEPFRRHT